MADIRAAIPPVLKYLQKFGNLYGSISYVKILRAFCLEVHPEV